MNIAKLAVAIASVPLASALAGSVTSQVQVAARSTPLNFSVSQLHADCSWKPGTLIAQLTPTGGNGKPITWSLTGSSDFVIDPTTGIISVGSNGISSTNCDTIENVSINATQ